MATSFQALPPPGPPSPGVVYPTAVTNQQPEPHSDGSFGSVFIVLAIIIVVSAVACCLGRFCSKKTQKTHQPKAKNKHGDGQNHKQSNNHGPKSNHGHPKHGGVWAPRSKERGVEFGFGPKDRDIEFGFEPKRAPSAKVAASGEARGHKMYENGGIRGHPGPMGNAGPRDYA